MNHQADDLTEMAERRCENCAAWDGDETDIAADCRKHAPVYVLSVQGGMWPTVGRKDWCCEWHTKTT